MLKLGFNWRDILLAPRLALSLQRMWIQLVGLSFGLFFYLVLSYLGLIAAGYAAGLSPAELEREALSTARALPDAGAEASRTPSMYRYSAVPS